MCEELLNEEYRAKRTEYKEIRLKMNDLISATVTEFFKCVKVNYVNSLKDTIDTYGVPKHKEKFHEFYLNYNKGELGDNDFSCFELLNEIYEVQMKREEVRIKGFYINVPQDFINSLSQAITTHGICKHKDDFEVFCRKYQNCSLTGNDIKIFKDMYDIYSKHMSEHNFKFQNSSED